MKRGERRAPPLEKKGRVHHIASPKKYMDGLVCSAINGLFLRNPRKKGKCDPSRPICGDIRKQRWEIVPLSSGVHVCIYIYI